MVQPADLQYGESENSSRIVWRDGAPTKVRKWLEAFAIKPAANEGEAVSWLELLVDYELWAGARYPFTGARTAAARQEATIRQILGAFKADVTTYISRHAIGGKDLVRAPKKQQARLRKWGFTNPVACAMLLPAWNRDRQMAVKMASSALEGAKWAPQTQGGTPC